MVLDTETAELYEQIALHHQRAAELRKMALNTDRPIALHHTHRTHEPTRLTLSRTAHSIDATSRTSGEPESTLAAAAATSPGHGRTAQEPDVNVVDAEFEDLLAEVEPLEARGEYGTAAAHVPPHEDPDSRVEHVIDRSNPRPHMALYDYDPFEHSPNDDPQLELPLRAREIVYVSAAICVALLFSSSTL